MINVQIIRENKHAVTLLDGNRENRSGFSGPAEIIDGLMQMQEEARLYRVSQHGIKGTGTDRGAAEAVAASVEQASAFDNISMPFEVWLKMGAICGAAQKVADKLNGVIGLPALKELTDALNTFNARQEGDERKAIDRVNDELAAEEAPTAGPENSVSIEELPYPELMMLLQSEQITVERYVEEIERREKVRVEQVKAEIEAMDRRRFALWFF